MLSKAIILTLKTLRKNKDIKSEIFYILKLLMNFAPKNEKKVIKAVLKRVWNNESLRSEFKANEAGHFFEIGALKASVIIETYKSEETKEEKIKIIALRVEKDKENYVKFYFDEEFEYLAYGLNIGFKEVLKILKEQE